MTEGALLYIGLVGLIVGSFLNVAIWRLPQMLEAHWERQDARAAGKPLPPKAGLNLAFPGSFCPSCKNPIRWYHNIPVLSYVFLKGKCGYCPAKISIRYPLIEILTGLVTLGIALKFGFTLHGFLLMSLAWALIALCFIDIDHFILPDVIVWPLLILGLVAGAVAGSPGGPPADLMSGIIGAAAAYSFLWGLALLFKKVAHKEGMGMGDFKLLAALGAWLGWQALIPLLLTASLSALGVAGVMAVLGRFQAGSRIPFGPYLCFGAWLLLTLPTGWLSIWWRVALP